MRGRSDNDASKPQFGELLESDEDLVAVLTGDGADLLVTERRVVIVRDGYEFRPRSGVRSWSYDTIAQVSLSRAKRGQATIVIRTGPNRWQAVSMFFAAQHDRDAEHVIGEIGKRLGLDHRRPKRPE
jgi:hypothetical protein